MISKKRVFRKLKLSTAFVIGLSIMGWVTSAIKPAHAMTISDDPVVVFAQCAGRLQAESDFARTWKRADQAIARKRFGHFKDLLVAVRTTENGQKALRLQLQAKSAHMALLWRAAFATSDHEARIATRAANRDVAFCRSMLPD